MFDVIIPEPDETKDQYFYRLCSMKDAQGYTWDDITAIMNDMFDQHYCESKYRKDWWSFNRIYQANESKISNEDVKLEELKKQKDEIYKAKKQLSDQRREYNKLLTRDARADHLVEKLVEAANSLPKMEYKNLFTKVNEYSEEEAVLFLSDWHYGQISSNIWNEYNVEICKKRISDLYSKVVAILNKHRVKSLHIALLGDMFNGAIHTSSRILSEELTCDQIIHVSEIIANFIDNLTPYTDHIYIHSTYGNHARTIQNKDDSIHEDNMEKIIPWWIKQRLQNNLKVSIIDSKCYEFTYFVVCDKNIVCTHGDLDKFKDLGATINNIFTKKYDICVDYTFSGDKHHIESFEQFNIESTLIGSLCGTDEFANNKRLYSVPSQTMCIFNHEDGKLCTYNIKL